MPWLVNEDRVLASIEVAASRTERRRGLIGRGGIDGALVLLHTRAIHTFGVRFPIDVAYCDAAGCVIRTTTVVPNRLCMPVPRARSVVEAEAGSFARWGLRPGDVLEVRS